MLSEYTPTSYNTLLVTRRWLDFIPCHNSIHEPDLGGSLAVFCGDCCLMFVLESVPFTTEIKHSDFI